MKTIKPHRLAFLALLLILATILLPSTAPAEFVFQLSQAGPDVVVTGGGTLNLAGLTPAGASPGGGSGLVPSIGSILIAPAGQVLRSYFGFSGPASWGSGSLSFPSIGGGDDIGISAKASSIFVNPSYVSGSLLSSSMTFSNKTFDDLGFTPGTYTYTWGSGETADSLTVTSEVPEPSTWALLGVGGVAILVLALRSRAAV